MYALSVSFVLSVYDEFKTHRGASYNNSRWLLSWEKGKWMDILLLYTILISLDLKVRSDLTALVRLLLVFVRHGSLQHLPPHPVFPFLSLSLH